MKTSSKALLGTAGAIIILMIVIALVIRFSIDLKSTDDHNEVSALDIETAGAGDVSRDKTLLLAERGSHSLPYVDSSDRFGRLGGPVLYLGV